jgi:hypothetical protein
MNKRCWETLFGYGERWTKTNQDETALQVTDIILRPNSYTILLSCGINRVWKFQNRGVENKGPS